MDTSRDSPEIRTAGVRVAVFAKAPIASFAKTRLIPVLGAAGAARLQRALTRATLQCARQSDVGPVSVWCAPNTEHRFFRALQRCADVDLECQVDGDLGERMHAAFLRHCSQTPLVLVGTDCPALRPAHIRQAAQALLAGDDAVFCPAQDGGYVLVGLRRPQPELFLDMVWSTSSVMSTTRARVKGLGLRTCELETLWDVDRPEDLIRMGSTRQ